MQQDNDGAVIGADLRGSEIAGSLFAALRALDLGAGSVRDGYPTGLRWLHGHLERTGQDTTEDAISELLVDRVSSDRLVGAARTQVPYPPRLAAFGDGVTRGTCDIVLDFANGTQAWIEVKGAWPYLRSGTALTRNGNYRHHLVGLAKGAARDFAKLAPMCPDDAAVVGVLVIGFDIDEPGSRGEIPDEDIAELERNAETAAGGWVRHDAWWPDPHAHRVYGDDRSKRCRTRCFLWLRETADRPLEQLAALLRRRNALDARIAGLIGRPPEKGHLGEFIAAHVFDIELHESAVRRGSDGRFRSGPLAGQSVNVKLYGAQEGMLDISAASPPDWYLVLTGPRRSAGTSRGAIRPLVVESAYLFRHEELHHAGVKPGVAASVRQHLWRAAQIYPEPTADAALSLTDAQQAALGQFSAESGASQGS